MCYKAASTHHMSDSSSVRQIPKFWLEGIGSLLHYRGDRGRIEAVWCAAALAQTRLTYTDASPSGAQIVDGIVSAVVCDASE